MGKGIKMENGKNKGFLSLVAIIIVVAIIAVMASKTFFRQTQTQGPDGTPTGNITDSIQDAENIVNNKNKEMEELRSMMNDGAVMEDSHTNAEGESVMKPTYGGTVLAGDITKTPLLEFSEVDYQKALAENKNVVLYFYANWCPLCKAEFPKMQSAFDELSDPSVVGFWVNFNDSETSDAEENLAREFGVAYQHTKVFIKDGERVFKSPESWDTERYFTEISKYFSG